MDESAGALSQPRAASIFLVMRPRIAPLALFAIALAAPPARAGGGPPKPTTGTTPAASTSKPKVSVIPPKYVLSIQFVRTADDDGGRASTLTKANAEAAIARANQVYRRKGGDVEFRLHSASNFDELIQSTALNRDCIMAAGQTDATINANTDGDLDNDGTVGSDADRDALCDYTTSINARTAYAIARSDRIIVYSRGGNDAVAWDGTAGHWTASHPSGGASSANGFYVRMPKSFGDDTLLAHEVGHYLHTAHTFGSSPANVTEARQKMEKWAADHPGDDPRNVFDGDRGVEYAVLDTPPDPRGTLLISVHGGDGCDPDPAKGRVTVPVKVGNTTTNYVLEPDRALVMSYFKGCAGFDHYQSKGQYEQIHKALTVGNRRGLVEGDPGSCYSNGSDPGELATTEQKLTALIRKISRCILLTKRPMPWEPVELDIYSQPEQLSRGWKAIGGVGVHVAREQQLLRSLRQAESQE